MAKARPSGRIGEIALADWQRALAANLWGAIVFTPKLRALGRGGILNVASAAGFAAAPQMAPNNVGAAAVLALSETLCAELAGSGVRVTVLCPTFVKARRASPIDLRLADRLLHWAGFHPERVVQEALQALDRGQLYVLPQWDARLVWSLKRYLPASYARGVGLVHRALAGRA